MKNKIKISLTPSKGTLTGGGWGQGGTLVPPKSDRRSVSRTCVHTFYVLKLINEQKKRKDHTTDVLKSTRPTAKKSKWAPKTQSFKTVLNTVSANDRYDSETTFIWRIPTHGKHLRYPTAPQTRWPKIKKTLLSRNAVNAVGWSNPRRPWTV